MALPWGTTPSSVFGSKYDTDVLKTSVQMIVLTSLGERPMMPLFGSTVMSLLAEPADVQAVNDCKESVRQAIARWDDRVTFVDLIVSKQQNTLNFQVQYKIKSDKNPDGIQIIDIPVSSDMLK